MYRKWTYHLSSFLLVLSSLPKPASMPFRADRYRFLFFIVLVGLVLLLLRDYCLPPMMQKNSQSWSEVKSIKDSDTVSNDKNGVNKLIRYDHNLPLIWIGGVPRSGTTLARAMLDAHPDVRCGEETRVIPRLLFMHNKMMASPIERARLIEAKVSEDVLNEALGAYILSIILGHGAPANRYCNKDPFTLKSIDRILRIFPQSRFILMVRDGRAVVHSIINRKVTITGFDTKTYRGGMRDWNKAIKAMWTKCQQVGPEFCMPVWYEQLVLHPERELRRITEFLMIPWDPIVLHHEKTIGKEGGISLSNRERSTDQVNKPVNLDALYKWVKDIPEDVKRDMDDIAPYLRILGYDPMANPPKYGKPDDMVRNNTANLRRKGVQEAQGNRLDGM